MREAQFLKQNAEKWKLYETELNAAISTDINANRFVELTDDLAYSRTFYPDSNTTKYLNGLAAQFHQKIYRNKKEKKGRIFWFWQYELPFLFKQYHRQFLYAFLFFVLFSLMGALSAKYDDNFVRLILGDDYVNMTNQNIEKGDPFGVYKSGDSLSMFFGIAYNNISVSFWGYVLGIFFSIGSIWLLFSNGLMMGSFQYYFIQKGLGAKFITVVFIHGTLELWSIIIAGAAGLILGGSILFPGTYSRAASIARGGKDGLKIVIGLVPLFLTAAFFESFVTRYSDMPLWVSLSILIGSLSFIIWYFIIYPIQLHKRLKSINDAGFRIIRKQKFYSMAQQKIQLRKIRDFGENFSDTFQFMRQEFKPLVTSFVLIAGIFILSSAILGGLYQKQALGFLDQLKTGVSAPSRTVSEIFSPGYFIFIFVTLLNIAAMRTVIAVYMKLYEETGESPTVQQVWAGFAKNFLRIFIYSLPQFLLMGIGLIFCLAPGVYLMVVLMGYPFIIVNETSSFGEAFRRSFDIIKENFWISLATYLVAYIIYAVSSGIVGIITGAVIGLGSYFSTNELSSTAAIVTSVLSVVQYLFYVVFFVSVGLHYYNLVEAKDGTGLEKRLESLGGITNPNAAIEEQY